MNRTKVYFGKRFMTAEDRDFIVKEEQDIDNLLAKASEAEKAGDYSLSNFLRIKIRAKGERIIRVMKWNYAKSTDCMIKRLQQDYIDREVHRSKERSLQERIASGEIECKDITLRHMIMMAEKCGFEFIVFYNLLREAGGLNNDANMSILQY